MDHPKLPYTCPTLSRKLNTSTPIVNSNVIISNYTITDKRLGKGSSATVYLGYHTIKKYEVAVKKFELSHDNNKFERRAKREISILQKLNHPNIIKMYDFYFDVKKNDIYIFLEYCPNGSIKNFLGKGGYLDEIYVNKLMKQLISGFKYLLSLGIYHRDIKPDNLLLSSNYNLKITDFGLSTMNKNGTFHHLCGSPLYMAPEILVSANYNKKSDIWSTGMVMFELLFGHHPLHNIKHITDLIKYFNCNPLITIPPIQKPNDINITPNCISLLKKILIIDINKRLSWESLFIHPWILQSINTDDKNITNNSNLNDDDDKDKDDSVNNDNKSKDNNTNTNITSNIDTKLVDAKLVDNNPNLNNLNNKFTLNHNNWSPLYLLLKWKYMENKDNKKDNILYNTYSYPNVDKIYNINVSTNTYSCENLNNINKKKCSFTINKIESIEINSDIYKNTLSESFLNISSIDSHTNNSEKHNSTLYFPKNINKMALTEPTIYNYINYLEFHQTWPLILVTK
jgi:serine/threonine protein kinase